MSSDRVRRGRWPSVHPEVLPLSASPVPQRLQGPAAPKGIQRPSPWYVVRNSSGMPGGVASAVGAVPIRARCACYGTVGRRYWNTTGAPESCIFNAASPDWPAARRPLRTSRLSTSQLTSDSDERDLNQSCAHRGMESVTVAPTLILLRGTARLARQAQNGDRHDLHREREDEQGQAHERRYGAQSRNRSSTRCFA